ncbi:hypothetical protein AJ80_08179 [Polytolypa hystricis UAMH7299]|uniref:Calcineurin-like phosphoesterase domain-containing protein n=1 Tax=Polytolypa hystricis (strain UAMH7299) TaxID=1447883 RepID=A0A2B7XBI6_POLH7|nr:hypothetical protein AJ80_08179 [Polytolypa hystricis UAMH7299]
MAWNLRQKPHPHIRQMWLSTAVILQNDQNFEEFRSAIRLLDGICAPLKLVIAGNHDFTMDKPMFKSKVAQVHPPLDPELVKKEYGDCGEIKRLFDEAASSGIVLLDEGTHQFTLNNGASLTVYASPFTPSLGDWGFQYHPQRGHEFSIGNGVDVVITHGPPLGIMDFTSSRQRAGCPELFGAVARSRPRLHCFGHIHEGWGAKLITWRDETKSKAKLQTLENHHHNKGYVTSHCKGVANPVEWGTQTLFVNAAIEGVEDDYPLHLPWVVEKELPKAG